MLVAELKNIIELDEQINQLHEDLTDLYAKRLALIKTGAPAASPTKVDVLKTDPAERRNWAGQQYDKLQSAWRCYDVELPAFKKLQKKLEKSRDLISELQNAEPQLMDNLEILIVPPSDVLPFPVSNELRYCQGFSDGQDYVNETVPRPTMTRQWRVLVVYAGENGLAYGLPKAIIETKRYVLGGYDTRGLGPAEYAAFSLQYQQPIDDGIWTLLLKDQQVGAPVVSAGFHAGRFRFDIDEANGGLDIDRYRPAVEVK